MPEPRTVYGLVKAEEEKADPDNLAAADSVPTAIPSVVEPDSSPFQEKPKRGRGRPALREKYRINMIHDLIDNWPEDIGKQVRQIKHMQLTVAEKAYILNHKAFKQIYDARLFDMFFGLEHADKDHLKLLAIVGTKLGLLKQKPAVTIKTGQMKMSANRDSNVSIQVDKS